MNVANADIDGLLVDDICKIINISFSQLAEFTGYQDIIHKFFIKTLMR